MDYRAESKMKNEERKEDEGMMGREEKKRDFLLHRDISCSRAVMKHIHTRCSTVNQRPFLTRHPRL